MMQKQPELKPVILVLLSLWTLAQPGWAGEAGPRRSQRVRIEPVQVASPDGRVKLRLLPNAERLTWTVQWGEAVALEPSPLSFHVDGYDLSSGVALNHVDRYEIQETYPWLGNFSVATNHCQGARLTLQHDLSMITYVLELRAYNDGVAYRHIVEADAAQERVPEEYSVFVLPPGTTVWYAGLAAGHYEDAYRQKDIGDVQPGEWAGPPLTFKLPGAAGYGAITEANLVDYSGMGLEADGRRGWVIGLGHRHPLNYPFELRYGRQEGRRLGRPAAWRGRITTPWRVVLLGPDLHTLVNSALLPNLCPPPDPDLFPDGLRTAWIKPGRAVWRYLDGGPSGLEGIKQFSRWAAQLGFEYQVVEGFWSRWSRTEQQELVNVSRQHGVGLVFWKHRNQLHTPQAQEEFFKLLHELGVAGAKIDFMDHEHKEVIDLYETLLRTAARYQVLVNFHGANKPTGRQRTLPNDLSREAVKGMEASRLTGRARHQTILPFTRYLAGPADYTPLHFGPRRGDTTCAHQIASLVILSSPLLTVGANPQTILAHPAVELIKSVPACWDATLVLPGSEIGQLAAYARRKDDTWFVAVMCGPKPQALQVPLSFLGEGTYQALCVADGADDASVTVQQLTRTRADVLRLELRSGGGFLARFSRH